MIAASFPLTPVPTVREIRIHKATPQSGLWRFGEADKDFTLPYWAHWWGGGLALARHILDHPETVAGKRVLDLGSGSGLVAIAAAKSGAAHVFAVDIDRYAIAAIPLNAAANGTAIHTHHGDLTQGSPPDVDLILVGDLFYEADLAERVTAFLDRCRDAGISALVGDPHRAHLPLERLQHLADYPGPDFGTGATELARNAVFAFRRA
jgi:predicted nicotinamide N-methyase